MKLKCLTKFHHFRWQVLSGCAPVTLNLRNRIINCDTQCVQCGAKETINYVLFECPPAFQSWALSQLPSSPGFFPLTSGFSNMDYLFWRLQNYIKERNFPWIIWYIWKCRNNKVLKMWIGILAILQVATNRAKIWESAQTDT